MIFCDHFATIEAILPLLRLFCHNWGYFATNDTTLAQSRLFWHIWSYFTIVKTKLLILNKSLKKFRIQPFKNSYNKSKNCEIWILEILLTFCIWMRTFTFHFRRKITLSKYWPSHFSSHLSKSKARALSCKIILKMIAALRLPSSSRSPDTIGLFPGPEDKDS